MKNKLIALGIISPVVLTVCVIISVAIFGTVGWLFIKPDKAKSHVIVVSTVAPLSTASIAEATTEATATAEPIQLLPDAIVTTKAVTPKSRSIITPTPSNNTQAVEAAMPDNPSTPGETIARLVIPKMKLNAPIVNSPIENRTWKVDHLNQEIGYLEGTAPPGSDSNFVLAAHVTLAKDVYGPFAGLGKMIKGDTILVYKDNKPYKYLVDGLIKVDRTAVEVTYPSDTGRITLITCNKWSRAENRYLERIIVKGYLVKN